MASSNHLSTRSPTVASRECCGCPRPPGRTSRAHPRRRGDRPLGSRAADVPAGDGVSTCVGTQLPRAATSAQVPPHRPDIPLATVGDVAQRGEACSSVATTSNRRTSTSSVGRRNRADLVERGGAGRDRTFDRGIMSRNWAVLCVLLVPSGLLRMGEQFVHVRRSPSASTIGVATE